MFLDPDLRDKNRLICSIDRDSAAIEELHPADPFPPQTARCGIYRQDGSGIWQASAIGILGEQVNPVFMISIGSGRDEAHLIDLVVRMNNSRFQEVLTLLKRTFGTPGSYQMSSVDTLYGPVSNATYLWTNDLGAIKLDMLTVALDRMSIQLTEQVKTPLP